MQRKANVCVASHYLHQFVHRLLILRSKNTPRWTCAVETHLLCCPWFFSPNFFFVSSFRRGPNVKSSTSQLITATKLAVARVEELNEDKLTC